MTTVPGIVSAIAALITAIAGAFYGGTQLSAQTPQPAVTVTKAAPAQTVTIPARGASQGLGIPQPSDPSVPTATTAGSAYLSDLSPVQDNEAPGASPSVADHPQKIGSTTYPHSVRMTCVSSDDSSYYGDSSIVYNVAGYKTLKIIIGVPSDATNASGNTAIIKFLKDGTTTQLVPSATIALDQPENTTVNLQGTSQLAIDCKASGGAIDVAFTGLLNK